ncbi:alpha/beta hydrolase [uncultured Friedmanniella sp.]|uniref:alpha/beta hydrolase n=1 Tax=uncultured Friedmanniella sp. TaxID=335381 RepID=UPI0035CAACAD
MNLRTRLLVGAVQLLPRPDPPTAAYLVGARRELPRPLARVVLGPVGRSIDIDDLSVPVPSSVGEPARLRIRLYRAAGTEGATPLVVNFHGGGFVLGNLTAADWLCGNLAARAPVTVASIEYRLAPEHPAPIPFEDCWAATQWLVEHAAGLGADREQVSVMGESAGGSLAALVALAGRNRARADPSWPVLRHQLLLYPSTDLTLASPSVTELPDAPLLPRTTMDWFGRCYMPQGLPHSIAADDPRVSPLHASDHSDLPPTLVVAAGQDPLRDDALRYADALEGAGVRVRRVVYPDAIHGFASIPLFEPAAKAALSEIVAELSHSS